MLFRSREASLPARVLCLPPPPGKGAFCTSPPLFPLGTSEVCAYSHEKKMWRREKAGWVGYACEGQKKGEEEPDPPLLLVFVWCKSTFRICQAGRLLKKPWKGSVFRAGKNATLLASTFYLMFLFCFRLFPGPPGRDRH